MGSLLDRTVSAQMHHAKTYGTTFVYKQEVADINSQVADAEYFHNFIFDLQYVGG